MRNLLRHALRLAWELPQSVLGASLFCIELAAGTLQRVEVEDGRLVIESRAVAVSLGLFVFWSREDNRWFVLDEATRRHELGHAAQSRMLGPLYLPLVGVPSSLRALYAVAYREATGRRWPHYFDGYPEDWADRLGGVRRAPSSSSRSEA
jgi:hypothetical protein